MDESVYYRGRYWNDSPTVRAEINRRLTGDEGTDWTAHLQQITARVFNKALFLNCGNGWVDRGFIDRGLVREGVGLDISEPLLKQARQMAEGRPLRYFQCDINLADFIEEGFDLVVNHAAGHHIRFIDRVFRRIALTLPPDGLFVSYDYVGPHRNQYPLWQWDAAKKFNATLDRKFRADLAYPHVPTMLVSDPSEAVHSELILPTIAKYFEIKYHARAGGVLAYLIITHNDNFWAQPEERREPVAARIMDADRKFLELHPLSSMFDYVIGVPNNQAAYAAEQEGMDELRESKREATAEERGGYYYPVVPVPATQGPILSGILAFIRRASHIAAIAVRRGGRWQ